MPHTTHPDPARSDASGTDTSGTGAPRFTVGVSLDGAGEHPAAWREEDADAGALFSPAHWQRLVDQLEKAGADYVALVDALAPQYDLATTGAMPGAESRQSQEVFGRLDALLLLSWIAPRTHRIGLIPTVTTTHTEPFHVATALQTLDHVSLGRAGWQARISAGAAEARAFGRRESPAVDFRAVIAGEPDAALDALLAEARDFAEVASRLWDSWEDDAIIRDTETGRFLDRERVHHVRFEGERFSVAGPSIVPRSPQGRPPITLLAHSEAVYRLAAEAADVVFVTPEPQSERGGASFGRLANDIVAAVRRIEAEVRAAGRAPLHIVADLVVALDDGTETGAERLARLNAVGPSLESDTRVATGTAAEIADLIAEWREAGIEGVRLRPLAQPADVTAIAEELLPELRRRGIADEEAAAPHPSLRERFGLGEAINRYAASAAQAAPADQHAQTTQHAQAIQHAQTKEVAA